MAGCEVGVGLCGRLGDIFGLARARFRRLQVLYGWGERLFFLAGGCRLNSSFRNVSNQPARLLFSSNVKKNIKISLLKVK